MSQIVNRISGSDSYFDNAGTATTSSTQPKNDGGAATAIESSSTKLDRVGLGLDDILTNQVIAGFQQSVISASVGDAVTATSVTGSVGGTSGYCVFTKAAHGLVVGNVLVVSGSTANSLKTIHTITAKDTNTFTTDVKYEASATAGNYQLVGNSAYINTQNNYQISQQLTTLITTANSTALMGNVVLDSIHKVRKFYTDLTATAVRGGYWNFVTGSFTNGYPAVSSNVTYDQDGTLVSDGSTDTATNPTAAAYTYVTYAYPPTATTNTLSKTLW